MIDAKRSRALTEAHRWRVYSAMLHRLACMAWSRAERAEARVRDQS